MGIWAIGFVTGGGMKQISEVAGKTLINIFIPSSPTPITGYVIFVDPAEITYLDIGVEEALRFAVSGGVLIPERQEQDEEVKKILPSHRVPKVDEKTKRRFKALEAKINPEAEEAPDKD